MLIGWTLVLSFFLSYAAGLAQPASPASAFTIARLKYSGGGDWYNDPSIIPNLLKYMSENTNTDVAASETAIEAQDENLFTVPVLFLTGHGKVHFSKDDAARLRQYLFAGGFLYADDDYGMDKSFRSEIKKVLPGEEWVELPFSHPLFYSHFKFPGGAPKIHEHDGGPPRTYGLFHENRLVVLYTFNTNISDGWADPGVHEDPPEIRQMALQMGTNIMVYALTN